ncbi:hypothetical protein EV361DRAFT_144323 [Lentinula raphanica]|nr:hypothetical protein EV361DRAFT_144323 [Lentinula raphanica]
MNLYLLLSLSFDPLNACSHPDASLSHLSSLALVRSTSTLLHCEARILSVTCVELCTSLLLSMPVKFHTYDVTLYLIINDMQSSNSLHSLTLATHTRRSKVQALSCQYNSTHAISQHFSQ